MLLTLALTPSIQIIKPPFFHTHTRFKIRFHLTVHTNSRLALGLHVIAQGFARDCT